MAPRECPPRAGCAVPPWSAGAPPTPHRSLSVLAWLERLIGGLAVPATHRALLRVHLGVGRTQVEEGTRLASAELPLLVHAALGGREEAALPLAGACALVYLGADLLDNVADDEVPSVWEGYGAAEMQLAASTYLAPLHQRALSGLTTTAGVSDAGLWRLAALFGDALLEMSAGQHDDFRLPTADDAGPPAARLAAERKSGAELALFARVGAALATDDASIVADFTEFGRCLGTATQIGSDVADLWAGDASRDLTNGKRTLPVAHALAVCCGADERDALIALLARCRTDASQHAVVRRRLLDAGSVRYSALIVEVYRQRARRHLDRGLTGARGDRGAAAELRAMIDELDLVPAPTVGAG